MSTAVCEDPFTLSNLPSDIVLNSIRIGQESIDEMRLICPRWNHQVDRHLNNRKRLPNIKSICWNIHSFGRSTIQMIFGAKYVNTYFFIHGNWNTVHSDSTVQFDSRGAIENFDTEGRTLRRLFKWLSGRCAEISKLEMEIPGPKFEDLAPGVLEILSALKIRQLAMTCGYDTYFEPQDVSDFLKEATQFVPLVEFSITQGFYDRIHGVYWECVKDELESSGEVVVKLEDTLVDNCYIRIRFIIQRS